ncbi:hypothetical protein MKZ38_001128 [Zalerion maritima]|uniref:Uncharacterized protein n=1 Tax=Zalerion maritima TaxID=339359 RepID=A0AAD5RS57_9PEZI|nr:hypothetical protein MKZ38_001128 [Zalerion maritima]
MDLQRFFAIIDTCGPSIDLFFHLAVYTFLIFSRSSKTTLRYSRNFHKPSSWPLAVHVLAGLFEIVRYHTKAVQGPVLADSLDILACLLQSGTNVYLAKFLLRGDKLLTRPAYQAGGLLRPFVSFLAYAYRSPSLHRSSVKIVDGFVYTRLVIWVSHRLGLHHSFSGPGVYSYGVFLGALLGISYSGLCHGVPIYLSAMAAILVVSRKVTLFFESQSDASTTTRGARLWGGFFLLCGFVDLDTLRNLSYPPELSREVRDFYVSPNMGSQTPGQERPDIPPKTDLPGHILMRLDAKQDPRVEAD